MAKHRIDIRGEIIRNDYKFYYDWFGMDSACPRDVQKVLNLADNGDDVDVFISSFGGDIAAGSDIYTMLREAGERLNIEIYITGEAHSAASVIACAGHSTMSPTALMLVHCVSTSAYGNHRIFEKKAEILSTADRAMCRAYMAKTGMTEEEALAMMDNDTWLNAEKAKEKGLVDEIMFIQPDEMPMSASAEGFRYPSMEQLEKVRALIEKEQQISAEKGKDQEESGATPGYEDAVRRMRELDALKLSAHR